jgi:hypothetical protein
LTQYKSRLLAALVLNPVSGCYSDIQKQKRNAGWVAFVCLGIKNPELLIHPPVMRSGLAIAGQQYRTR